MLRFMVDHKPQHSKIGEGEWVYIAGQTNIPPTVTVKPKAQLSQRLRNIIMTMSPRFALSGE